MSLDGDKSEKKNCKRTLSPAEGNGLDSPVAKKKKTKKKRKKSEENGDTTKQGSAKKQKLDTGTKVCFSFVPLDVDNVDIFEQKKTAFKTAGGTEVEDTKEGSGKIAKPGRKVNTLLINFGKTNTLELCRCLSNTLEDWPITTTYSTQILTDRRLSCFG